MKALKLIPLLLLVTTSAQAFPSDGNTLASCTNSVQGWSAELRLDSVGQGHLRLRKSGVEHLCTLSLKNFRREPRAAAPLTKFVFNLKSCAPALSDSERQNFLPEIQWLLRLKGSRDLPQSEAQWHKYAPLSACPLDIYRKEELDRNAEKWRSGTFGR